jgi:hypothetical protein
MTDNYEARASHQVERPELYGLTPDQAEAAYQADMEAESYPDRVEASIAADAAEAEAQPYEELGDDTWWASMRQAYNYGTIEPREGTAEAEAFRRFDAYTRAEAGRVEAHREQDQARARAHPQPEPAAQPEAEIDSWF